MKNNDDSHQVENYNEYEKSNKEKTTLNIKYETKLIYN